MATVDVILCCSNEMYCKKTTCHVMSRHSVLTRIVED